MNTVNQIEEIKELETFICNQCDKKISKMNQVVHEARCRGIKEEEKITLPSVSAASAINQKKIINTPVTTLNHFSHAEFKDTHYPIKEPEEDRIPCEFCQNMISLSIYSRHITDCLRNFETQKKENQANTMIPCEECRNAIDITEYEDHLQKCLGHITSSDTALVNEDENKEEVIDGQKLECDTCMKHIPYSKYNQHLESHQTDRPIPQQNHQNTFGSDILSDHSFFQMMHRPRESFRNSSQESVPFNIRPFMHGPRTEMDNSNTRNSNVSDHIQEEEQIVYGPDGSITRTIRRITRPESIFDTTSRSTRPQLSSVFGTGRQDHLFERDLDSFFSNNMEEFLGRTMQRRNRNFMFADMAE